MPRENIEDSILENVMANTGDDFSDQVDENIVDDSEPSEPAQQKQQTRDKDFEAEESFEQPLPQKGQPKKEAKKEEKKPRTDAQGNILDEAGNIVARGGMERRLHTQVERSRAIIADLEQRNVQLAQQIKQAEVFNGLPAQLGLDNSDLQQGLGIVALFKHDPVQGARKVIELALASGVALNQIIDDEFVPNVSLSATQKMMEDRLKPLTDRFAQQERLETENREAQMRVNRFLTSYPIAEVHREDIAKLVNEYKQGNPNADPYQAAELALHRVLSFCKEHGLDPERGIAEQVEEIKARNAGGAPDTRQQTRTPMAQGRSGSNMQSQRQQRSYSADDSYAKIIRDAMAEAGIK